MSNIVEYKNYKIVYSQKPIGTRLYDWGYFHNDYDGAPDWEDRRSGFNSSLEACKVEIDELEEELQCLN